MTKQIIEGNTIIHDWMGKKRMTTKGWEHCWKGAVTAQALIYHISWDCIMPIVEKIEALGYITRIEQYPTKLHCMVIWEDAEDQPIIQESCYRKIDAVWIAVVEFIKWYNQKQSA